MAEKLFGYTIIAAFFVIDFFIRKDTTASSLQHTKDDRNSTRIIIATFCVIVMAAEVLEFFHFGQFKNKTISEVGVVIMMSGLILRIHSIEQPLHQNTNHYRSAQIDTNGNLQKGQASGLSGNDFDLDVAWCGHTKHRCVLSLRGAGIPRLQL